MQKSYIGIQDCFYRVSAKAFVKNSEGKILLCKADNGYWDVPGGGIDHGEEIHEALKREIMEEMGLRTINMSPHPFYTYITESTVVKHPICVLNYFAELEHYKFTRSDECQEIGFFGSQEAKNLKLYTPIQSIIEKIEKDEV